MALFMTISTDVRAAVAARHSIQPTWRIACHAQCRILALCCNENGEGGWTGFTSLHKVKPYA